jgi:hypothetical protein
VLEVLEGFIARGLDCDVYLELKRCTSKITHMQFVRVDVMDYSVNMMRVYWVRHDGNEEDLEKLATYIEKHGTAPSSNECSRVQPVDTSVRYTDAEITTGRKLDGLFLAGPPARSWEHPLDAPPRWLSETWTVSEIAVITAALDALQARS